MFTVKVQTNKSVFKREYNGETRADRVLFDCGVNLPAYCAGNGICGKCKITLNGRECLACRTYINTDSIIDYTQDEIVIQGVSEGMRSNFSQNPIVSEGYAAAIDIGTTTIAVYIYKFPEGELVKSVCVQNEQTKFGADVISRIKFSQEGNREKLQAAVKETIQKALKGFDVRKFVVCGNTAMLHFLSGKDASPLAVAPYQSENLFGQWWGNAYLIRCASSFVGADITAAMLASGMDNNATALLVDIGTNGEMVLKRNDEKICCSTAAGPCFEGAGISCGIPAVAGAIDKVFIENGKINFTTIGGVKPIGICGSGLVDAIAVLIKTGIVDSSGYMEENFYFPESEVFISPQDVRNFQLAKSAVRSGIDTLMNTAKVTAEEIEKFYIAGGFGSFLNIDSAVTTGLIPKALAEKAVAIGNAAGIGATMVLLRKEFLKKTQESAKSLKTLNLADSPYFMEKYIENMQF